MTYPSNLPTLEKHCDYAAIHAFAVLSDDFNPIHVDRAFAMASPMGGLIAHGPMSMGLLWQSLYRALGDDIVGMSLDVRFLRPVREDDVIRAGGKLKPGVDGTYELWVHNQKDELVVTGEAVAAARVSR